MPSTPRCHCDWSERVVVYALSDLRALAELDNLPGGDPDRLDGVAFPVRAGPRTRTLASTRFMLHPRMIYRNDQTRDRLIRHELTHVALGLRTTRCRRGSRRASRSTSRCSRSRRTAG